MRVVTTTTQHRARRAPALLALALVVLGVLGAAARLDGPGDGSDVGPVWPGDGRGIVVASAPGPGSGLRAGDRVTGVDGRRAAVGTVVTFSLVRDGAPIAVPVRLARPAVAPLLRLGWGDLVFVVALAGLAVALYLRRPEQPSTGPLLVFAAALLGSTLTTVAGLPVIAVVTGGPQLWLYELNTVVAYSVAWGAMLAFALTLAPDHPWLRRGRVVLAVAYAAPLAAMLLWAGVAAPLSAGRADWLRLVATGQTAVVAVSLLAGLAAGAVAYRAGSAPTRARLRWLVAGGLATVVLGIAGWHLPVLIGGRPLLPAGALGLSALPFVAGVGVALRRHRLFDIERLANRSLVYAATVTVLVAGYAVTVAILVSALRLSDRVAAALAAAGAALALAPLRHLAQSTVNRVMYGDRHDPAGALDRLGARLRSVLLPDDVLPAIVATVARSLRVPYAAIELAAGDGFQSDALAAGDGFQPGALAAGDGFLPAAQHGTPVGAVHTEPLRYQGTVVGRLLVSARGTDDPLDPVDLELLAVLAGQIGTAVQAVRLHEDLTRSRAQVVASREDERRRLRRDLHDGLGPALAAIGLKAELAARGLAGESAARELVEQISRESALAVADVRRLVEALRPPALDELGLVGAVRSRAATLGGAMAIDVSAASDGWQLPAAVETAAYRIAVEAVTNAVRHSGARTCRVVFAHDPRGLEVTVTDDGAGLDASRPAGVGLRSMRERAAEVGGECSVQAGPRAGTVVRAWLPTAMEAA